jgi:hypothetical protein
LVVLSPVTWLFDAATQENVAPAGFEVSPIFKGTPLQTFAVFGVVTTGDGSIVITYTSATPAQVPAVGVTVMFAVIGVEPVLVEVNDGTLPVPLAPNPMFMFELVQLNVTPLDGVDVNELAGTVTPLQ